MSASDRIRGGTAARVESPAAGGGAPAVSADPESYSGWRGRTPGGRGRHAAITRNLGSLANYRSWADRMKGSFTDDPKDGTAPPPSGSTRR